MFGVIEPRKGQQVFLEAAKLLAARFPTARFWVVGPEALADKAGYARRLRAVAETPALAGRVTFTGHRSDVAAWMRAMDVVTLPSIAHESLGMVLVEAIALGRPTVASRIGGTPEVITDGENGWLVPGALVVIERSARSPEPVWPAGFEEIRSRRYGESTLWYGHAGS